MTLAATPLCVILLTQQYCNTPVQDKSPASPERNEHRKALPLGQPPEQPHPAVHRFELTPHSYDVAFDTQTGRICRTWDWGVSGTGSAPDPVSGKTSERKWGEFSPTCLDLYREHLSGPGGTVKFSVPGGKSFAIPADEVAEFLKDNPTAVKQ